MKNKNLRDILVKIFSNSKVPMNIKNLKIGDLKQWDSVGHVNLILEIEKKYKIKFNTNDFLESTSIKKIEKIINKKNK